MHTISEYVFTLDAACDDYDWLVVYDEMSRQKIGTLKGGYEPLRCPKEHTILCTWEPIWAVTIPPFDNWARNQRLFKVWSDAYSEHREAYSLDGSFP